MTAPDLARVLGDISALARRAGDLATRSPDFPAHEAATIMEALTGARLDRQWAYQLGPERAGAVHFAKSIVVLSSMAGAPHGLGIGMAGVLDDLRAPAWAFKGDGFDPARRVCLRCGRAFASDWRGHRICSNCAPLVAGGSLDGESAACMGVAGCLQGR
ncbi:MAG: hypothetical protein OXI57_02880 [Rhodospirillales bacterium]|nr:hypothetical protein [Rhodospirillales bacterium]